MTCDCADLNPRSDGKCSCPPERVTEADLHAEALRRAFESRRSA